MEKLQKARDLAKLAVFGEAPHLSYAEEQKRCVKLARQAIEIYRQIDPNEYDIREVEILEGCIAAIEEEAEARIDLEDFRNHEIFCNEVPEKGDRRIFWRSLYR